MRWESQAPLVAGGLVFFYFSPFLTEALAEELFVFCEGVDTRGFLLSNPSVRTFMQDGDFYVDLTTPGDSRMKFISKTILGENEEEGLVMREVCYMHGTPEETWCRRSSQ